jgi:glucose-1-phosphate thymidylyltransferase
MEEKPKISQSNLAITGLYFFASDAIEKSKSLKVSHRNELEIVDLLKIYWNEGQLKRTHMPRGTIWLDTGSFDAILEASHYVKIIQTRQNLMIANLEEIAWRNGWLTDNQLRNIATNAKDSQIREYLLNILKNSD